MKNKANNSNLNINQNKKNKQDKQKISSKKKKKKNISLPEPLKKIVDVVAKPLKKLSNEHKTNEVDEPFAENYSTDLTTSMKFFYSNDKFIDTFDDKHLYEQVCRDYPALSTSCTNLQHKRNSIVEILKNEEYIQSLNDQYGMNIFDVVSFLFRLSPSLFRGIFIKKIQNVVKTRSYAKKLKKHRYKIAQCKKAVSSSKRRSCV